ncbi:MAG: hypothetical protein ACAI38_24695 [Myxococcota bacterium]|nr:hypothetical protein [Myxococcota bacterium]
MTTQKVDGRQVLQVLQQHGQVAGAVLTKALENFDGPCKEAVAKAAPGATDITLHGYSAAEPTADKFELVAHYAAKVKGETVSVDVPVTLTGPSVTALCTTLCMLPAAIAQAQGAKNAG